MVAKKGQGLTIVRCVICGHIAHEETDCFIPGCVRSGTTKHFHCDSEYDHGLCSDNGCRIYY